jgi:hypothetical protein
MTGTLLTVPVFRAVDANGLPLAGALLQFYLTGTTTPANVYTSSALTTPLSNPVAADSGGLFTPIYLDPTVTYRVQLQNSAAALIRDVDPVNISVTEATQAQVNAGSATGVFVSPAKLAAWIGIPAALGFTPLNKAGDTATNLLISNTTLATNSAGYLGTPINEQDASYTLVLSDAGKMVRCNSASAVAYTIPPNASVPFPQGTVIVFRNLNAGGVLTLARGSGVAIWKLPSNASQDIAVAPGGLCTLIYEQGNWVATGVAIS